MGRLFYYLFNASVIFNFLQPENPYFKYLDRYVSIYEIFLWIAVVLILTVFKPVVEDKKNIKFVEKMDKPFNIFLRYVDYLFVAFVGVFVGDMSLFIALVTSCIVIYALKDAIKNPKIIA